MRAFRSGVGTRGTVSNVLVRENELSDVGGRDVVETDVDMDTTTAVCKKNKLNGVMCPSRCARTITPAKKLPLVTGAMLRCSRNRILAAPQSLVDSTERFLGYVAYARRRAIDSAPLSRTHSTLFVI